MMVLGIQVLPVYITNETDNTRKGPLPDAVNDEHIPVVALRVKANNAAHVQFLQNGDVALGGEGVHAGRQLPTPAGEIQRLKTKHAHRVQ
jgi:hypothetical protein